jgi:hypothetical protein
MTFDSRGGGWRTYTDGNTFLVTMMIKIYREVEYPRSGEDQHRKVDCKLHRIIRLLLNHTNRNGRDSK